MYCTVKQVKDALEITPTTDDNLLEAIIGRAQGLIDSYTGRVFECDQMKSRYFQYGALDPDDPWLLHVDHDLFDVHKIWNADDATSPTEIPSTEWWVVDANGERNDGPPWQAIRLKYDSDYAWDWDTDCWVRVEGFWAYSDKAPATIEQACIRLTSWIYHQLTATDVDVVVKTPEGFTLSPANLPLDVRLMLDQYKRHSL